MNKNKLMFLTGLILVIVGIFYIQTNKNKMIPTTPSSTPIPTVIAEQTVKFMKETDPKNRFTIDVSYPQFETLQNKQSQTMLNTDIKNMMDKQVDVFKREVSQNTPPAQLKDVQAELIITYETLQANDNTVSLQFQIMDSQIGAAHPNNYNQVFNFDVKTGKQLQLNDLFKPNSNYLQKLSDIAQKDLLAQQKDNPNASDFINEGTAAKEENYALFTLTADSLVIIFNPATVAPDYVGTVKVTVPYEKIADIRK